MPNLLNIGTHKVRFDTNVYEIKQENDNAAIVAAKGLPNHEAIISIRSEDPASPSSTDRDGALRDTKIMARQTMPNLPSLSMSAAPSKVVIDGRDGFYVRIDFFGENQKRVASAERVFCLLSNGYVLNILSVYLADDDNGSSRLIEDLISGIHIEMSGSKPTAS